MTRYKKQDPEITRRKFINTAFGGAATLGVVSLVSVLGQAHPAFRLTRDKMPPMNGDVLVHAEGEKTGQPVVVADLSEKITRAYPMGKDAQGADLIRSGDPNNIVSIFKYPAGTIKAPTNMQATIDGQIVCYSDICTHAGCTVADDTSAIGQMKCPCHSGQYDPTRGCKVTGGPPPHPLAQLPIKQDGDKLVVTGYFLTMPYPFTNQKEWEDYQKQVEGLLS